MYAHYLDPLTGEEVAYGVRHLPVGGAAGFASGTLSGLLGIGGGVINVPIMVLVMGLPLKASIATSNFMIGVTAATRERRSRDVGLRAPGTGTLLRVSCTRARGSTLLMRADGLMMRRWASIDSASVLISSGMT